MRRKFTKTAEKIKKLCSMVAFFIRCNVNFQSVSLLIFDPNMLITFKNEVIAKERELYICGTDKNLVQLINTLVADAENALTRQPPTVTNKETCAPSGNKHDYYTLATYWWPNPHTADGLPYIKKDGMQTPWSTAHYTPESGRYDRTRIQQVFDDTILLALAYKYTNEKKYALQGVRILECFFVNPETFMTPHLKWAQVRMRYNCNKGSWTGIIDFKDIYYYLDAVRILISSGEMSEASQNKFKQWLSLYLRWLLTSSQGVLECYSLNNHGTYYDVQVLSIATFLGEKSVILKTIKRMKLRMTWQFLLDGSQPYELSRPTSLHYCCYNFSAWLIITEIVETFGIDIWSYTSRSGVGLKNAASWLLSYKDTDWPYIQTSEFDKDRFISIWHRVPECITDIITCSKNIPISPYIIKPKFKSGEADRPYWNLGKDYNKG